MRNPRATRGGEDGEGRDPPAWSALSSSSLRIMAAFETYFTAAQNWNEGRIKVLPLRGGVNVMGMVVKRQ